MALNREQILKGALVRSESVDVPTLGGAVNVRGMTGSQVIEMARDYGDEKSADFPMLLFSIVDDAGKPIFDTHDLPELLAMPTEITLPLLTAVKRLSGMGADAPKAIVASS